MTKKIRVENADNSNYLVCIRYENLIDGAWVADNSEPQRSLSLAADLQELYIHSTRRVVVEEGEK